jgi:hypothetical protein
MFARRLLAGPALLFGLGLLASAASADGPQDNQPDNVRPVPPPGSEVPADVRAEIQKGLADLQAEIKAVGNHELLPDVQIYEKAVRWALDYNEVYDPAPPKDKDKKGPPPANNVRKVLAAGLDRAKQLRAGQTPWTTQKGPVLRGYRSKIDGSVQPYWLMVPNEFEFAGKDKHRLDFWWHGRGETLSEANFMANSPGSGGGIIPVPGMFVLHPYGRYCNANKFAGEVDTFECLEHVRKHYRIDDNRIVARGFSMGGAACWQYATHFPTLWCANAPGAGFSETPEFLKVFQKEDVKPEWYEQKLWHLYNASDYAVNVFNLPTVAYSGEIDSQKQAADVMEREMKKEGLELVHIIGPKTGHAYEKGAKEEVNKRIDAIVAKGKDPFPQKIRFTTFTTRYNECAWVTVEGLEKHWERARVEGELDGATVRIKTQNVSDFSLHIPGLTDPALFERAKKLTTIEIDGQTFPLRPIDGMAGIQGFFLKSGGKWQPDRLVSGLRKRHGLQGPIDDAFMNRFVMVKPTGRPMNSKTAEWVEKEFKHATDHWRRQFRGDAPVKSDTEVNMADLGSSHLILWGDPMSNAVLAKIADKLPIRWTERGVQVGDQTYPVGTHVPVLIFPNPLNPIYYVVLNSGFTFREYDYLNNARQVPKLPDYAIIDVTTPPNSRYPGKVVRAGFFGEKWDLLPNDGQ